ncbi:MAG: hypothetical protein C4584_02790 [Armatimonadetes bacterium]|nr:MAG: hypothetical protein C4584_02790 [Armatimonadota bacterium]
MRKVTGRRTLRTTTGITLSELVAIPEGLVGISVTHWPSGWSTLEAQIENRPITLQPLHLPHSLSEIERIIHDGLDLSGVDMSEVSLEEIRGRLREMDRLSRMLKTSLLTDEPSEDT